MTSGFGLGALPYGIFRPPGGSWRVGVRFGDAVLDLHASMPRNEPALAGMFARPSLNGFMAGGPGVWAEVRERAAELLRHDAGRLLPLADVELRLPFDVADYVDFYSSRHHAERLGAILRPGQPALTPNWLHMPIGYHGRAGTVVVSGTPIVRPQGQRRRTPDTEPDFAPSSRLDIEAELGFVVGVPSVLSEPVPAERFADHVFGIVVVNDWSARDIQAWEYQPLGPFLGKSFATSISAWVLPLTAVAPARCLLPPAEVPRLDYLRGGADWGLRIDLEITLNGTVVSRPPFAAMSWSPAQQLAHMTVNGAPLRTGDLFASGTVSGPERRQSGSLIELTWNGAEPLALDDGSTRGFLEDGDEVTIRASAPGTTDERIALGEVTGRILPARR